jgi:precorrin-3B C17-methyltransferase
MSQNAFEIIKASEVIVGYKPYLDLLASLIKGKEVISFGMTEELQRCTKAIEKAGENKIVALISSGDPGIYGMAGLVLEIARREKIDLDFEIIPGITAATAAAASLGAPIMNDFGMINLSDLLTPWEVIEKRLASAAVGDFVIVLYNPASKKRKQQIIKAKNILSKYKPPDTPVGIVRRARRGAEEVIITNLSRMLDQQIDMLTTVIVGNSSTFVWKNLMVTPRGYKI